MLSESTHRAARAAGRLATTARAAHTEARVVALVILTIVLLVAAILVMWPFVAALVLAAWAAHLSRPLFVRVRRALHGRETAAAVFTATLVVLVIAPIVLAIFALIPAAKSLIDQLRTASGGKGVLEALVSEGGVPGAGAALSWKSVISLVRQYGASASRAAVAVAGVSIDVLVGALVFFTTFYALLVHGDRWWSWFRERTPFEPTLLDRLAGAFHEAGRGLIVGNGLTALIQGVLAAVLYLFFGVPRALLLGLLSVMAALVPMLGTAIIWVPVCLGLALAGHPGKALGLAALCTGVVGTIDNLLRPWLSRRFEVGMPAQVVLVAMLGGIVALGGWGLFLGPLIVRLASEMLDVCRERRVFARGVMRSILRARDA